MQDVAGIHHVTAVAGDPRQNLDFYTGLLGLRLVKVTVNSDEPQTYHLYYGDGLGRPGTLLTFLCAPQGSRGRKGAGQASVVALAIPPDAVRYWASRLAAHAIRYEGPIIRWDETVLTFFDPDDLQIELVARPNDIARDAWVGGPVPADQALRGLHGVTLIEEELPPTAGLLAQMPGFRALGTGPNHRHLYAAGDDRIDLLVLPGMARGQAGLGTIHHVAWRTPSPQDQEAWRKALLDQGVAVTPVLDGKYFRSIYFREPGGVLFEMATDLPGLTVDEAVDALGTSLQLPEALESRRAEIESSLPQLRQPGPYTEAYAQVGGEDQK